MVGYLERLAVRYVAAQDATDARPRVNARPMGWTRQRAA